MDITTERTTVDVGGDTMGAYLAKPVSGGPHPGVVLFMEIFGINSHIRDVCERLAKEGYVVLAPDFFHRTAPGIELGYDDAGMAEGMKYLGQLQAEEMIADAKAAIAALRAHPECTGKVGATGFCIGGHMTYLAATTGETDAAASWYGGGIAAPEGPGGGASTVSRTGGIAGPVVCFFGGEDGMIPPDQVETIRSALQEAGVEHEVVVYDGADHGFHCDQRASYHEASSQDAWRRMLALFGRALAG